MKILRHIFPVILSVMFLCSCGERDGKVIPRGELAEIYAQMLLMDQWIVGTPGARQLADTTLVYEPILNEYGYTKADYRKSVDEYMNDPERFSRILRSSGEKLEKRLKELRKRQKQMELEDAALKEVLKHQTDYSFDEYFPYLADEPYVHYYDSVTFEPDSFRVYRLVPIERADTLYDRIRMIIRDSLAVSDNLSVTDSLSVEDSLNVADAVTVKDSIIPSRPVKVIDRPVPGRQPAPILRDTVQGKAGLKSNRKWQVKE